MEYGKILMVDMKKREQKTPYDGYEISSLSEAITFAKEAIGDIPEDHILICAVDKDMKLTYIQLSEKMSFWNPAFLVEIYRKAILSDAEGVITFRKQKNYVTELDFEEIRLVYELSRLGEGMGIKFMDHIILDADSYLSFWKAGILPRAGLLRELNRKPFLVGGIPAYLSNFNNNLGS